MKTVLATWKIRSSNSKPNAARLSAKRLQFTRNRRRAQKPALTKKPTGKR